MADIKWTFFADTNAAERAIQALEQKFGNMENAMKRTARSSKTSTDSMMAGLSSVGKQVTSTIAAYAGLGAVINGVISGNQRLIAQAEEAGAKFDDLFRKFRIQGGLTEIQGKAAQANILKTANIVAATPQQAGEAATQMVSSGFSAEQAQGPALLPFLKTLAASNQFGEGVDSQSMARAMSAYMNSQGMNLTGANMEKVGTGFQRLFKSQDLQLADIESLAKVGSVFKGKLTMEEQFSSMAALKNSGLAGPEAATALRNTVMAMTSQGLDKGKVKALSGLGLKPGDIDLQGESYTEAMGRMNTAFGKANDLTFTPLLKQFFEKENVASATTLVNSSSKIAQMNQMQGDVAGFNADADIATSGRNASGRRLAADKEAMLAARGEERTNWRQASENYLLNSGTSDFRTSLRMMGYDAATSLGISPKAAAGFAVGDGLVQDPSGIQKTLEDSARNQTEQTKLLQTIADNTSSKPDNVRRRPSPNGESARGE